MSDKGQRCDSKQRLWSRGPWGQISGLLCPLWVCLGSWVGLCHTTQHTWLIVRMESVRARMQHTEHTQCLAQIERSTNKRHHLHHHPPHVIITFTPNCLDVSVKHNLASNLIELLNRLATQTYLILVNYGKMGFSSCSFRNSFVCWFVLKVGCWWFNCVCVVGRTQIFSHMDLGLKFSSTDKVSNLRQFALPLWVSVASSV